MTGSLALLTDAAHLLTDAVGLGMALLAAALGARPATDLRTFGFKRAEALSAAAQAAVLLVVGVVVVVEAARRLVSPPEVAATGMLVFGAVGLLGNAVALAVLAGGRRGSLNLRAAFLEVANDALGSVAVLVAAGVIAGTGWQRADPVVSLLIAALIVPRTALLLRDAVHMLLDGAPRGVDVGEVRRHILDVDHVHGVHDLHVSSVSSDLPVLTAHVVVDDGCFLDGHAPQLLDQLQSCLVGHFDVEHSTFQLEPAGHAHHEQVPRH